MFLLSLIQMPVRGKFTRGKFTRGKYTFIQAYA